MEKGEQPESDNERLSKVELDQIEPADLFEWAKNKQAYIKRLNERLHPQIIDDLVEQLERYIMKKLTPPPEIFVETNDAYITKEIKNIGSYSRIVDISSMLYADFGVTINGKLFGFHRGREDDLRAYISTGEEPQHLMGGIYTPLISVSVEQSQFYYAEATFDEQYEQAGQEVLKKIEAYRDDTMSGLFLLLISHLNDSDVTSAVKFIKSAETAQEMIRRIEDKNEREFFTDLLWEVIQAKLHLTVPHDIEVSSHRVLITKQGYKRHEGAKTFTDVKLQMGIIMSESRNPVLGLYFTEDDQNIQVPIHSVRNIYRNEE